MFSMEDRRRAVDLYFTQGMTIRKVVAELGYPSEGALAKWVREDPRYTGACRRSYTLECKTNAARRALGGDDVEELRRQVEALRLENAVLRETIDVLKAGDPSLDPCVLTNGGADAGRRRDQG